MSFIGGLLTRVLDPARGMRIIDDNSVSTEDVPGPEYNPGPAYLPYADFIRIYGIVAVVVLHVSVSVVLSYGKIDLGDWMAGNILNSLCRWAVPAFVMLSGALLLRPEKTEQARIFLGKRARRIGIPFVFWFLVYFAWSNMRNHEPLTVYSVISQVLFGPYYHFYFLYVIAAQYVMTPWLRVYLSRATAAKRLVLIAFFLSIGVLNSLLYIFSSRLTPGSPFVLYLRFIFFMIGFAGYYIAGYHLSIMVLSRKAVKFISAAFLLACAVTLSGTYLLVKRFGVGAVGLSLYDYFSPSVVIMSLCVFVLLRTAIQDTQFAAESGISPSFRRGFSGAVFGIYLIHPLFLDILGRYVAVMPGGHKGGLSVTPWLGIPLLSVYVVTMSFLATLFILRVPYVRRVVG
jgi:surface polysaccharide O-acyltransferase-like enzyme